LRIDPDSKRARDALDKVASRIAEQKFNQAMSEGFAALDKKHLEAAGKAFRTARALRPDSAEAADGLAQVDLNIRLQKIAFHRDQAAHLEKRENWQAAAEHYRAALDVDPNLVFAKQGRVHALARARLARQLEFHIEHPGRLSSDSVYAQAVSARDQALELENKGPRLREQLVEISKLLVLAATPVRVRLESDSLTEVVVYKVGELGTFDVRELELRPGRYTAVGSRDGYQDVRREFTVIAGETPAPVAVRCKERI
jgi:tetratricopeptide (TPR) repeat protein